VIQQTKESESLCCSRTSTSTLTPRTDVPQAHRAATTHTGDRPSHTNNKRVHVAGVEMDPVKMWEKLAAVHVQKVCGVQFNTLDAFLAVRKSPDKSLPSVVARVNSLLQDLKALCSEGYTIDNLLFV
jgi:hypothetical protein